MQDTVTHLIAAVRRARREGARRRGGRASVTSAHDYDDPGKPRIAWYHQQARDALVDARSGTPWRRSSPRSLTTVRLRSITGSSKALSVMTTWPRPTGARRRRHALGVVGAVVGGDDQELGQADRRQLSRALVAQEPELHHSKRLTPSARGSHV